MREKRRFLDLEVRRFFGMSRVFRRIPSVHELLDREPLKQLVDRANRTVVVGGVREFLGRLRDDVASAAVEIPSPTELAHRIADWIVHTEQPRLRPVINGTGVLLHTGLGRAPLAAQARKAMEKIGRGYASVEIDLETGNRSQRLDAVDRVLRQLTDCESSAVFNNNAGATLISLAAVASGKEVIVSRGQLVEIGGSFRLPEVMRQGGVLLREVGTTNKTRISDYESSINNHTAALMAVHTSNYVVRGFTQSVNISELVDLGQRHNLPVIDDIGSGALWDFSRYGIADEPLVKSSLEAGTDLVLFSGDKLLGGPQCGIVVGNKKWIDKIRSHPLARALRIDKTTLAALDATLQLYLDPETVEQHIPLLQLLSVSQENLQHRAEHLAPQLAACEIIDSAEPLEDQAFLGGGSVPTQSLPTVCVALAPARGSVESLSKKLRTGSPPVMGRIKQDRLLIDLRTVFADQDLQLIEAIKGAGSDRDTTESNPGDDIS